ncbi:hypothetical protein I350_06473 [Cryptococcus amylolentus CBS 6273]|uniref:Maintenance of telomere capping protein 1 n=1 Tax=Cryptococcus amylolentus CBS 6273 TaxID=1296118 RepID=A0A1E3JL99_9TREE|nr:hypothetical protein I350_06473 [Cryptococcus amylolentus CBS 6273]
MPPKGKRTKAEEALDFLSNLDNLDAPPENTPAASETPRVSTDSTRKSLSASRELPGKVVPTKAPEDDEAESHLAFLEAQMQRKTKPLSDSRSGTPLSAAGSAAPAAPAAAPVAQEAFNVQSSPEPEPPVLSGWGSLWSSATSALQQAQRVADEQYQKVKAEGVSGVTVQLEHYGVNVKNVQGVDLTKLRKGAEDRLGGIVKGVDLEKIRKDLLNTTTSTLTTILDTVAPPISEHETLELWLSHPMQGYAGVEGVIYRAWARILEQTDSGELIVIWSPAPTPGTDENEGEGRSINPVEGWEAAWDLSKKEVESVKGREKENPEARARLHPDVPVTVVPIFLYLQPVLVPLPFPEPPISSNATTPDKPRTPPKHLQFLLTLEDPEHKLTFTTVTQPTPEDWMEVEYERSEWVEERLVEVIRTGVEVVAQDYVATRMGLKPSAPQAAAVAALVEQASQENAEKEKETTEEQAEKKSD